MRHEGQPIEEAAESPPDPEPPRCGLYPAGSAGRRGNKTDSGRVEELERLNRELEDKEKALASLGESIDRDKKVIEEELALMEGLSCAVTPIFVHVRYSFRNRLRNRRISAINRLFARLIRAEDEAGLLDEALLHATRLFSADAAAAMLVGAGRFIGVRSLGMNRPPTAEEMEIGLTGEVLNTRKGVRLRSYMDHPKAVKEFFHRLIGHVDVGRK